MRRRALITGAGGGLGRAFAWELAANGWDLLLSDLSGDALRLVSLGIVRAHGVNVATEVCDLSDSAERSRLIRAITSESGKIGAVVNVAGFDIEGAFLERERDGLLGLMRVNMEAGVELTHAAIRVHCGDEPLRVINIASLAAFFPMPYKALYAASKGFVVSTSLALREEFRGRATVTVLCPAGMPTTTACVQAIEAQGLMGRLTTVNTSTVVHQTYRAAMRGKAIVIPGSVNRALLAASAIVPRPMVAALIGRRWSAARGYGDVPAERAS